MRKKAAKELTPNDRVVLHGMEFTVKSNTPTHHVDKTHNRTLHWNVLRLDDGLGPGGDGHRDFDDTGELRITKDPDDKLEVLDPNERAPQVTWQDN